MEEDYVKYMVLFDGFKSDRSHYLRDTVLTFLNHLVLEVEAVQFGGLTSAIVSLASSKSSLYSQARRARETFEFLMAAVKEGSDNFILVTDTKTPFFERRRDAFSSPHCVSMNFGITVKVPKGFTCEIESSTESLYDLFVKNRPSDPSAHEGSTPSPLQYIHEKHTLINGKKGFTERITELLSDIKKMALLNNMLHVPLDIYLRGEHSSLAMREVGYTLFYSRYSQVIPLLLKVLVKTTTRKRWTIYFCTYAQNGAAAEKRRDARRGSIRLTRSELKFRRELKFFCESEKITNIVSPGNELSKETVSLVANAQRTDSALLLGANSERDVLEASLLIEGMDKTLVVGPVPMIKALICFVKRRRPEDRGRQIVPVHSVVKITVKGGEITEGRVPLTKTKYSEGKP